MPTSCEIHSGALSGRLNPIGILSGGSAFQAGPRLCSVVPLGHQRVDPAQHRRANSYSFPIEISYHSSRVMNMRKMVASVRAWLQQLKFDTLFLFAPYVLSATGALIAYLCGLNIFFWFSICFFSPFITMALLCLAAAALGAFTEYPLCRCGRCKGHEYRFIKTEPPGTLNECTGYHYRCSSCHREWVEKGRAFYEVTPFGPKPYKKRFSKNIGWWIDATGK